MRLLHTKHLEFQEFFDSEIPEYAILSHRWGAKEASFQEFHDSKDKSEAHFSKIKAFCSLASRGHDWVWIDTCCIDKRSSAELSEAINSMFRWYEDAAMCYVHLSDVVWVDGKNGMSKAFRAEFRQSAWFTRGWTLQELLAPRWVSFHDSCWEYVGNKQQLEADISAVTGIKVEHLRQPSSASVATKMSWASKRKTSRVEDVAYCLLGIFDVNMPLLYGEGRKAFLRLEMEIIKKSDDESIFAWRCAQDDSGMLAPWPSAFAGSGDIIPQPAAFERSPYSMCNKGLEFHVPDVPRYNHTIVLRLNCWDGSSAVKILLQRQHGRIWRRVLCDKLDLSKSVPNGSDLVAVKHTEIIYIEQDGL
ncbi:hypothetical protein MMC16_006697 [Acarospora aff. strigata]|nr:hypothetical protein [Acarospora aff. strigata]